jgi:hypothetical protein
MLSVDSRPANAGFRLERAGTGAGKALVVSASAAAAVKLVVLPGQGHNMFGSFFRSQELVDFVIAKAREGGNR